MLEDKAEALEFLKSFTHSPRTNLKAGKISNHDAAAFLFWRLGAMKCNEIIKLLRAWRGNVDGLQSSWFQGKKHNLSFTYFFNTSIYGGYGFVGNNAMTRGNIVGHVSYKTDKDGTESESFRRTYWYRSARGVYTPTVECAKRVYELGIE